MLSSAAKSLHIVNSYSLSNMKEAEGQTTCIAVSLADLDRETPSSLQTLISKNWSIVNIFTFIVCIQGKNYSNFA